MQNPLPHVTMERLHSLEQNEELSEFEGVCAVLEALQRAVQESAADPSIPAGLRYRVVKRLDKVKEAVQAALRSYGLETDGIICK